LKFFLARSGNNKVFRARSPERDKSGDRETILPIKAAIDSALSRAEAEHGGLKKRFDDVTARASMVAGNESDEYLSRDASDTSRLGGYESDMQRANFRLKELAETITHLKFIRAAFQTRFPQL
jgi:hypothetical protein